jgi:hypothetical protein
MKNRLLVAVAVLSLLLSLLPMLTSLAQDGNGPSEPAVWEHAAFQIGEFDGYEFTDVQPGNTIYLYLESLGTEANVAVGALIHRDDLNNLLATTATDEEFAQGIFGNTLQYTVESDRSLIFILSTQEPEIEYRLLIGRNVPDVLSGTSDSIGPSFVRPVENDTSVLVRGCEDSPESDATPRLGSVDNLAHHKK